MCGSYNAVKIYEFELCYTINNTVIDQFTDEIRYFKKSLFLTSIDYQLLKSAQTKLSLLEQAGLGCNYF